MEDEDFIKKLMEGDHKSFCCLVENHENFVFRTSFNILLNEDDAKDVVQETFIQVYQSIDQFKKECKLSTWIYRIAVTKSLDLIKSRTRKKRISKLVNLFSQESNEPRFEQLHYSHPGAILENKERSQVLLYAISRLPENQQVAFSLSKLDSRTYQEIAEIMDLSIGAVESLLFRAKSGLKKILENYYRENEG